MKLAVIPGEVKGLAVIPGVSKRLPNTPRIAIILRGRKTEVNKLCLGKTL